MAVDYINVSQLNLFFTALLVKQVFTDDGGSQPGPRLDAAVKTASRTADGILLGAGFTEEQIEQLLDEDDALRCAVGKLVMAAGMTKPEWHRTDSTLRKDYQKEGETYISDVAQTRKRSVGEAVAGKNPIHSSRITVETPQFVFAPQGGRRAPGGF